MNVCQNKRKEGMLKPLENKELPSSQLSVMRVITLKESFDTSPYYQILI